MIITYNIVFCIFFFRLNVNNNDICFIIPFLVNEKKNDICFTISFLMSVDSYKFICFILSVHRNENTIIFFIFKSISSCRWSIWTVFYVRPSPIHFTVRSTASTRQFTRRRSFSSTARSTPSLFYSPFAWWRHTYLWKSTATRLLRRRTKLGHHASATEADASN